MWVKAHDTQANKRGEEPYKVRLANEIAGGRFAYKNTARWSGAESGMVTIPGTRRMWQTTDGSQRTRNHLGSAFPIEEFARLLGHWLSVGSINGDQVVVADAAL